jgi:Domain of unknown function (DUF1707)
MDGDPHEDPRPALRASDVEREQAIALLKRHLVDGRLTWEEFSERLDKASLARTRNALREVLGDLPRLAEPGPPASADRPWWAGWLGRPAAALAVVVALLALPLLGAVALGHAGPGDRPVFFPFFPFWPLLLWWLLAAGPARRRRRGR